jgi:histidinol-phosphate aminotransferase
MLKLKIEIEEPMKIRPVVKQTTRKSYEEESGPKEGDILDCALGRNSFGTSARVVEFARQYDFRNLWDVADTGYIDLKQEICKFWSENASLGVENIKVANGSAVVLSRFNKLFIEQGVKVLGYLPQFKEYILEVDILGGYYEADPLDPLENFKFNPDRFISKMEPDQSIVYIDNPNNPTGQFINLSDIEKIVKEAAKKDIVALIDEALTSLFFLLLFLSLFL